MTSGEATAMSYYNASARGYSHNLHGGRGRGFHGQPFGGVVHKEDSQPNEAVNRRRSEQPPAIRSSLPPQRGYRGHPPNHGHSSHRGGRGRGAYSGSSAPWTTHSYHQSSHAGPGAPQVQDRVGRSPWFPATSSRPFEMRRSIEPLSNVRNPDHLPAQTSPTYATHTAVVPEQVKVERDEPSLDEVVTEQHSGPSSPAPPAAKRRRTKSGFVSTIEVKRERSSPPAPSGPRLVTSGSARYTPVPKSCLSSDSQMKQNRKQWAMSEGRKLIALGLSVERAFFREDGMVIDWMSPRPVMSDTLLPPPDSSGTQLTFDSTHTNDTDVQEEEPSAAIQAEVINHSVPTDGVDHAVDALSPAPGSTRPSPLLREMSCEQPNEIYDAPSVAANANVRSTPRPSPATTRAKAKNYDVSGPSRLSSQHEDVVQGRIAQEASREERETAALHFLKQYIETFDEDRSALAMAYSHIATFSIDLRNVHGNMRPEQSFLTDSRTKLKQGRMEAVATLLGLDDSWLFCNGGEANVAYDIADMGINAGVLLVCYSPKVHCADGSGKQWSSVQRFLLMTNDWSADDMTTDGLWPMVAISHQMTVHLW